MPCHAKQANYATLNTTGAKNFVQKSLEGVKVGRMITGEN